MNATEQTEARALQLKAANVASMGAVGGLPAQAAVLRIKQMVMEADETKMKEEAHAHAEGAYEDEDYEMRRAEISHMATIASLAFKVAA